MRNDDALSAGGMIFSIFCLFLMIVGIVLIVSLSGNSSQVTDNFGNNLSSADPSYGVSGNLTGTMTNTGTSSALPVVLVAGAIFVCFVAFAVYAVVKQN